MLAHVLQYGEKKQIDCQWTSPPPCLSYYVCIIHRTTTCVIMLNILQQVELQQLILIQSVCMYPNISPNNGNNGALSCSWKEATSIVFKDIIPIHALWHRLLNLSRPTQKAGGPLTNVKGIILFLQLRTPPPFSSFSHRGMNLDGSLLSPLPNTTF